MTHEQLQAAQGKILHFPTVLGGVVPIYNMPGVNAELKFTGPVLADIFLGKITKWNDPAIAKVNEGVSCRTPTSSSCTARKAPARPTSSPTILAKVSPEWKSKVGVNGSVNWPAGIGAKGSDGTRRN